MAFRLIRDGDCVPDVGANHCWFAIHLARRFPGSVVKACEPVPATFEYLRQNLDLDGVTNVHPPRCGLGDKAGQLAFYVCPEGSVNASMAKLSRRPGVGAMTCPVMRIDDLDAAGAPLPDFLKVDVEGAELLVFQGAVATLRRTRAPVFAEMLRKRAAKFAYHPNAILELFADLGYRCFRAVGATPIPFAFMDERTIETNFFFLHPERNGEDIRALERGT